MSDHKEKAPRIGLRAILGSVLASFGGVQSRERHERDFQHGRARDFILVGVLVTVLFIAAIWGIVRLVIGLAGA